ncbi:uncharacterized protein LOC108114600 [Drosophila eugracilis]|uniref:uncharacterized protein LOC108114600 n=1 Tax=Drosophila eugracilis TaxID=29029 RepID=UPI0007E6CBB5|nr:uncharacterized protein LOC108114600 [Drosophila eugracilis]
MERYNCPSPINPNAKYLSNSISNVLYSIQKLDQRSLAWPTFQRKKEVGRRKVASTPEVPLAETASFVIQSTISPKSRCISREAKKNTFYQILQASQDQPKFEETFRFERKNNDMKFKCDLKDDSIYNDIYDIVRTHIQDNRLPQHEKHSETQKPLSRKHSVVEYYKVNSHPTENIILNGKTHKSTKLQERTNQLLSSKSEVKQPKAKSRKTKTTRKKSLKSQPNLNEGTHRSKSPKGPESITKKSIKKEKPKASSKIKSNFSTIQHHVKGVLEAQGSPGSSIEVMGDSKPNMDVMKYSLKIILKPRNKFRKSSKSKMNSSKKPEELHEERKKLNTSKISPLPSEVKSRTNGITSRKSPTKKSITPILQKEKKLSSLSKKSSVDQVEQIINPNWDIDSVLSLSFFTRVNRSFIALEVSPAEGNKNQPLIHNESKLQLSIDIKPESEANTRMNKSLSFSSLRRPSKKLKFDYFQPITEDIELDENLDNVSIASGLLNDVPSVEFESVRTGSVNPELRKSEDHKSFLEKMKKPSIDSDFPAAAYNEKLGRVKQYLSQDDVGVENVSDNFSMDLEGIPDGELLFYPYDEIYEKKSNTLELKKAYVKKRIKTTRKPTPKPKDEGTKFEISSGKETACIMCRTIKGHSGEKEAPFLEKMRRERKRQELLAYRANIVTHQEHCKRLLSFTPPNQYDRTEGPLSLHDLNRN